MFYTLEREKIPQPSSMQIEFVDAPYPGKPGGVWGAMREHRQAASLSGCKLKIVKRPGDSYDELPPSRNEYLGPYTYIVSITEKPGAPSSGLGSLQEFWRNLDVVKRQDPLYTEQ